MTNWESREMVRTEDGYVIVLECPEGDVYYKFFVSDSGGGADGKHWKGDWVVDRNQEVVSNRDFWNPVSRILLQIDVQRFSSKCVTFNRSVTIQFTLQSLFFFF